MSHTDLEGHDGFVGVTITLKYFKSSLSYRKGCTLVCSVSAVSRTALAHHHTPGCVICACPEIQVQRRETALLVMLSR